MIALVPLMVIPFILYNLAMIGLLGSGGIASLQNIIMSLNMMSGAVWTLSLGDLLILIGLAMLFVEILKATRSSRASVMDHMMSMILFVVYLVEFLLVKNAATQIFFILMVTTFIDVIAGFTISIRSAGRDVSIGL
jgi:hypothetical protein